MFRGLRRGELTMSQREELDADRVGSEESVGGEESEGDVGSLRDFIAGSEEEEEGVACSEEDSVGEEEELDSSEDSGSEGRRGSRRGSGLRLSLGHRSGEGRRSVGSRPGRMSLDDLLLDVTNGHKRAAAKGAEAGGSMGREGGGREVPSKRKATGSIPALVLTTGRVRGSGGGKRQRRQAEGRQEKGLAGRQRRPQDRSGVVELPSDSDIDSDDLGDLPTVLAAKARAVKLRHIAPKGQPGLTAGRTGGRLGSPGAGRGAAGTERKGAKDEDDDARARVNDLVWRLKRKFEGQGSQVKLVKELPARQAQYATVRQAESDARVREALKICCEAGRRLYTHQAEAIECVLDGTSVVVATPTASGKSTVFHVPVMTALCNEISEKSGGVKRGGRSRATAMYVFPLKALSNDQMRNIERFTNALDALGLMDPSGITKCAPGNERKVVYRYDGDIGGEERAEARARARVILTNPDMIHLSMCPHHDRWKRFIKDLKYVVIDEAHSYGGVFGSNVGLVLRRFIRLCNLHGSDPVFILASATISNPGQHAQNLLGKPVRVIDQDGSPCGPRFFAVWDPPLVVDNRGAYGGGGGGQPGVANGGGYGGGTNGQGGQNLKEGYRKQAKETASIVAELAKEGLQTLAFARARQSVERLALAVNQALQGATGGMDQVCAAYTAALPAQERRRLESEFGRGTLKALCSTSALELGIDLGNLDCTVHMGFPGLNSLWQQAGRAGRRGKASLSILVLGDAPLELYYGNHAEDLFSTGSSGCEACMIDPANRMLLPLHLTCAAYEAPIFQSDAAYFPVGGDEKALARLCNGLKRQGKVEFFSDMNYFGAPTRNVIIGLEEDRGPAMDLDIRPGVRDPVIVRQEHVAGDFEKVEGVDAIRRYHPGAKFFRGHRGFRVKEMNLEKRECVVEVQVGAQTYTRCMDKVRVSVSQTIARGLLGNSGAGARLSLGCVTVVTQVGGFEEFSLDDDRSLGKTYFGADEMLQYHFSTRAFVTDVPFEAEQCVKAWYFKRAAEDKARKEDATGRWQGNPDNMLPGNSHMPARNTAEEGDRSSGMMPVAALLQEGCEAALEAMRGLLPKFAMCDTGDIRTAYVGASDCIYAQQAMDAFPGEAGKGAGAGCHSRLIVYDQFIGGVGLADRAYERGTELWGDVRETVRTCPCTEGCPRCIGAPKKGILDRHAQDIKAAALIILDALHGEWALAVGDATNRVEGRTLIPLHVQQAANHDSMPPAAQRAGARPECHARADVVWSGGSCPAEKQGHAGGSGGAPLRQVAQNSYRVASHVLPSAPRPAAAYGAALPSAPDSWLADKGLPPQVAPVPRVAAPELSPEEEEEMLALVIERAATRHGQCDAHGPSAPPPAHVWAERARVAALARLHQHQI